MFGYVVMLLIMIFGLLIDCLLFVFYLVMVGLLLFGLFGVLRGWVCLVGVLL